MELFIFARFHALPGDGSAVQQALRDVITPTRKEAGCLSIHAFRSVKDSRLFHIHSRWVNEAAFDIHVDQTHTVKFVEQVQPLIDHPLDTIRTNLIE
jgi:quinol monooxygenase YgiN